MSQNEHPIQVIIRFRPLIESELLVTPLTCVDLTETEVNIFTSPNSLKFTFDKVLPSITSQSTAFESGPSGLIESYLQGFNSTILAYGQVFSGKTYTMYGDLSDPEKQGLIPNSIHKIFEIIDSVDDSHEFLLRFSFFSMINEKIFDLLSPVPKSLKLRNTKSGLIIQDLQEFYISSESDLLEKTNSGLKNKKKNDPENSSHSFFALSLLHNSNEGSLKSKLLMVDLAGVERISPYKSDQRSLSIRSVNVSLSSLSIVISALCEKNSSHVPYRGSKLTRILEDSLGGNSKMIVIVTCTPSPASCEDTASALRFALRLKSVKNRPLVNKEHTLHDLNLIFLSKLDALAKVNKRLEALQELKNEAAERRDLRLSLTETQSPVPQLDYTELKQELDEIMKRILNYEETNKALEEDIEKDSQKLSQLKETKQKTDGCVKDIAEYAQSLNEELKSHTESIEEGLDTVDKLTAELEDEKESLGNKEKLLENAVAETEHLKCKLKCLKDMRSSASKAAVEEEMRRKIKEEKLRNKIVKEKLKDLQEKIDTAMLDKMQKYIGGDDIKELGRKIWDLDLKIDNERLGYLEDEQKMTDGQKELRKRNEYLEISVGRITKDFRSLTERHSAFVLEKNLLLKKINRLEERALKYQQEISKVDERLLVLEKISEDKQSKRFFRSNSLRRTLAEAQLSLSVVELSE